MDQRSHLVEVRSLFVAQILTTIGLVAHKGSFRERLPPFYTLTLIYFGVTLGLIAKGERGMTPKEFFGSKQDFLNACRLAAMRGLISNTLIPGSRLDRDGWDGVIGYLNLPIPWQDLKQEVESRSSKEIFQEYNNFALLYERKRVEDLQKGEILSSKEFAQQMGKISAASAV